MATYSTSDIRKGLKIEMDGQPYTVVEFQFVKPGKGTAFTRTKLKNLITGSVLDRTWRSGESLEAAEVEDLTMQFLYNDGVGYVFMDTSDYSQLTIRPDIVGDTANWLVDNMEVQVLTYKREPVAIEVPNFVELEIVQTDPGLRGNTAQGGTKPATLSTGAVVNVPLFVEEGAWIKVDTRDGGAYVERVKR